MIIDNKKKIVLLIIGLSAVIGLIVLLLFSYTSRGSGRLLVSKVPSDSTLFIDGVEIKKKNIDLEKGTYLITATRDGFVDYSEEITIDDFTKYIVVSLIAEEGSEEGSQWVRKNNQQYLDQEELLGLIEGDSGAEFLKLNPIIQNLPINNYTYDVGYKLDQTDTSGRSIIITVHADDGYRNAGIGSLYNTNYDPADMKLEFNNYVNPFEVEK